MLSDSLLKNKQRVAWVDSLRGIAIFCIVLGHFTELAGDFYAFVFTFHVQLFFFVAGIFASQKGESFKELASYCLKKLLIPYAVLCFINVVLFALRDGSGIGKVAGMLKECLFAMRNNIFCANLWFFPCLILMTLLFFALKKLIKNRWLLLAVCLVLSLAMRLIKEEPMWLWSADSAVLYLFYYALGDTFSKELLAFDPSSFSKKTKPWWILSVVLSFLFACVWFLGFDNLVARLGVSVPTPIKQVIYFFAAVILLYLAAMLAYAIRRWTLPQKIGRATFIIAATEQITRLILLSTIYLFGIKLTLDNQFKTLIYTCIVISVSYFLFALPLKSCFPALFGRLEKERETD